MPMVDAFIPEGALSPEKEAHLIKEVTNLLIKAEGFDPATNRVAQSVSVVFLHRPTALYVAGTRATEPRYRIVPSVPEGKYSDEAVQQLIREITEAFARAEGTKFEDIAPRVWVFPTEIPEGRWGARGSLVLRAGPDQHHLGSMWWSTCSRRPLQARSGSRAILRTARIHARSVGRGIGHD